MFGHTDLGDVNQGTWRHEQENNIKQKCNEMLYERENISTLWALLGLLNVQSVFGWSYASVTTLFQLLKQILPENNQMPDSHSTTKNMLATLALDYESIHACPNGHVLSGKS